MKKFFCIALAFSCLAFSAFTQVEPVFSGANAEYAVVVDLSSFEKKIKDSIVLVNQATNEPVGLIVYGFVDKKGEWTEFGSGFLKHFNDAYKIEPGKNKGLKSFSHIAIVPSDKASYVFKSSLLSNDLYLFMQIEDFSFDDVKENTMLMDVSQIQRSLKNDIRLVSSSEAIDGVGFYVFGDRGQGYEFIGSAYLKGIEDTCLVQFADKVFLGNFSRIALASTDEERRSVFTTAKSNDLYIYIND